MALLSAACSAVYVTCLIKRMDGVNEWTCMLYAALSHLAASSIHAMTERLCLGAQTNNSAMFAEVLLPLYHSCMHAYTDAALTGAMLPAATRGLQ